MSNALLFSAINVCASSLLSAEVFSTKNTNNDKEVAEQGEENDGEEDQGLNHIKNMKSYRLNVEDLLTNLLQCHFVCK